jgi:hypothetical protein
MAQKRNPKGFLFLFRAMLDSNRRRVPPGPDAGCVGNAGGGLKEDDTRSSTGRRILGSKKESEKIPFFIQSHVGFEPEARPARARRRMRRERRRRPGGRRHEVVDRKANPRLKKGIPEISFFFYPRVGMDSPDKRDIYLCEEEPESAYSRERMTDRVDTDDDDPTLSCA